MSSDSSCVSCQPIRPTLNISMLSSYVVSTVGRYIRLPIILIFASAMGYQVNQMCNHKLVSQSSMSSLRKNHFRNVEVKAVGSSFSKCTECDFLVECIAKYPRGCDEWQALVDDRDRHLNYQRACRNIYAGWSALSVQNPSEFLCIIHDMMDTTKTAIPRMQRITKATAGLGQIPISCTGMLT